MNTLELIDGVFKKEELEKMAHYELEKVEAFNKLDKVADAAGADFSALNEQEKIELYNLLMTHYNNPEVQAQLSSLEQTQPATEQAQPVSPGAQVQTQEVQPTVQPQADFSQFMSDPARASEFQMKVAEVDFTSTRWASKAADTFLDTMGDWIPKLAEAVAAVTLQKIAEAMEGVEEKSEKEDKSNSFEELAKLKAEKMKGDMEKKAAFDALLEKRALEILAGK